MENMGIECGGFVFVSNFDSGNLDRVELVFMKEDGTGIPVVDKNTSAEDIPDYEFNIWTKRDCDGTEFENCNSTWFYFGIKGGTPFATVKLNIMNLNRQSRMYSQGMAPVYRFLPGRSHWERIKDKPTYIVDENVFVLSFKYRTLENPCVTTYFSFTYPYTYTDLQNMLNKVDAKFLTSKGQKKDSSHLISSPESLYYHRECICHSLEGRRIDLITISSHHNITPEREPRLTNLFPDTNVPRAFKFHHKKVVLMSARVHPGETPSSFVLNGFLNHLLSDDQTAVLLRKMYVFKLIPVLNPDGVFRGHYRTDTRGVNLNRMYMNPSVHLHPSVYAARALVRYHHHGQEVEDDYSDNIPNVESPQMNDGNRVFNIENQVSVLSLSEPSGKQPSMQEHASDVAQHSKTEYSNPVLHDTNIETESTALQADQNVFSKIRETLLKNVLNKSNSDLDSSNITLTITAKDLPNGPLILKGLPRASSPVSLLEKTPRISDNSKLHNIGNSAASLAGNSMVRVNCGVDSSFPEDNNADGLLPDCKSCDPKQLQDLNHVSMDAHSKEGSSLTNCDKKTSPQNSGLFLYIDLHGHASKKGIFMYGNHFDKVEDTVECMLLPKIMSINSQNFHFTACNFTERNMYLRDRRDGMSREGSGRVAVLKTTGLVRSYTLECNYNTGRLVNMIPTCAREHGSKARPVRYIVPPKYTPQIFEEVGRALGISILDLTGSNPYSRIPHSEFRTLGGIREWLKINCVPEQAYLHKLLKKNHKHTKPQHTQVVRASSSSSTCKPRRRPNKHDKACFARTRRLTPLAPKTCESSKLASGSGLGVHCCNDIKSLRGMAENTPEDSERKENVSSFQVSSSPQSPSGMKLTKALACPKENVGPGSSHKCSGSARKLVGVQSTSSGVLKQVLAMRIKCTSIGALAGSSKSKEDVKVGRLQKISTLGPNKNSKGTSNSGIRIAKFRRAGLTKPSQGIGCTCSHTRSQKGLLEEKIIESNEPEMELSTPISKLNASNEKEKYCKEELKTSNDPMIVKQGSKRLKISSIKHEHEAGCSSITPDALHCRRDGLLVEKLKLKEICFLKVGKEKKLFPKYMSKQSDTEAGCINKDVITWDCEQSTCGSSNCISRQTCVNLKGKQLQRKLLIEKSVIKPPNPVRASKTEYQPTSSKVKYGTKSEKQSKGKTIHLLPIKTLQKPPAFGKKKTSDQVKKRSMRRLSLAVGKFRVSPSDGREKKKKKVIIKV